MHLPWPPCPNPDPGSGGLHVRTWIRLLANSGAILSESGSRMSLIRGVLLHPYTDYALPSIYIAQGEWIALSRKW